MPGCSRSRPRCATRWSAGSTSSRPLIRTLIGLRGLPQRLAADLTGHHTPAAPARPRLRLADDMAWLGFSVLGERPGMELVWGQLSQP